MEVSHSEEWVEVEVTEGPRADSSFLKAQLHMKVNS